MVKKSQFSFWWNFEFLSHYFAFLVHISKVAIIAFGNFSYYFKTIKQAAGHNHENTIFQLGQSSFDIIVFSNSLQ